MSRVSELAERAEPGVADRTTYRWWILGAATLANVVVPGIGWNYVIMVVPQVLADLRLDVAMWGILWSAISLGVLVFSIPAGALADRFGVRSVVGSGILLAGVSLLLRAAAVGFVSMFLAMLLFGFALGVVFAVMGKVIGSWFPLEELGTASGISQAGIGVGFTTAMLSTPVLLARVGDWRGVTRLLAFVTFGVGALWLVAVRDRRASPGEPHAAIERPIRRVLRVRDVWTLAACNLLYLAGYLGALGYVPTYFTTVQKLRLETAGFVTSVGGIAFIVGSLLLPALSDRIGRRRVVYAVAMIANGAAVLGYAYLVGVPLALAAIVWGTSAGAIALLFVAPIEMKDVGPAIAGSAIGVLQTAGFAGGFLGPVIGMLFVAIDPVLGFVFWMGCYVLSALLFLTIRETGWRAAMSERAKRARPRA
jgi:NNP family nitrate/nitrite transporter-like MFS transporter